MKAKKVPKNKFISQKDLKLLASKLLAEKKKISGGEAIDLFVEMHDAADPLDAATLETLATNESVISSRNVEYLKKINNALKKILNATYGQCEECDLKINLERLLARPTATLCIICKEEQEREERRRI